MPTIALLRRGAVCLRNKNECIMDQELKRIQRAMTLHSRRTLLHMQQQAGGGRHGRHVHGKYDVLSEIRLSQVRLLKL